MSTLLTRALERIANHPHSNYNARYYNNVERQYSIGCADGHRCAAEIAQTALVAYRAELASKMGEKK